MNPIISQITERETERERMNERQTEKERVRKRCKPKSVQIEEWKEKEHTKGERQCRNGERESERKMKTFTSHITREE